MKNILYIAKANIMRNRSNTITLFIIILVVSMLLTIGLSVLTGVNTEYMKNIDKLNSLHSAFIMTKDMYRDSFENLIKNDSRVTDYNIDPAIYPERVTVNYGGVVDLNVVILNLDTPRTISIPKMLEEDVSIPQDKAVYLPYYAKLVGYKLGDEYTMVYKNKPLNYVVSGFFETNEMSTSNGYAIKNFLHDEAFRNLAQQVGSSVWIAIRFFNPYDSVAFNSSFRDNIDVEISSMGERSVAVDFNMLAPGTTTAIMSFAGLVMGFAFIIALISLMVIRFRVTNSIDDNMHGIGVLGASGYTSGQIIASFILEYGLVALPAAILGVFVSMPMFSAIRTIMTSISGILWSLGANPAVGLLSALFVTALLLVMVLLSCRRIHKLPPVVALRGGISTNSFRRNFFPLSKGSGNVQTRLGLKNMFAYGKLYAMIGLIIAGISLAVTFMVVTFQNFVLDNTSFIKMVGVEISDVSLTVSRHTDADALANEIEKMPEVRKTSMMDWGTVKIEGENIAVLIANDYSRMESMTTFAGRFPEWDNEIAMPEMLAKSFGKEIGDTVKVKSSGVTQDYIISGYYSTTNLNGLVCAMTLEGYQRLNPNQKRGSVNVYLKDGVTVENFTTLLENSFGVVNVYKVDENDKYAAAKARAEEKISNYLQQYNIDSVEYAAIYNGEIILSGSSSSYQIERIINYRELINAQTGIFASGISITTQFIAVISLIIIALILSMTVKSIISKRRRELGVLKAGGFTTRELATQLGISFIPAAILGVLIGCVGGGLLVNPAFAVMLGSMGVKNATFTVNPVVIAVVGLLIILITFGIATFSAMRIKNISAYELLSE